MKLSEIIDHLYFNENFTYRNALEHYNVLMFNHDAVFTTLKECSPSMFREDSMFIRPDKDLKEFNGSIIDKSSFMSWLDQIRTQDTQLSPDTEILMAKASKIDQEWRLFIVDGKVAGGSKYRSNHFLDVHPDVPQKVVDFALSAVSVWTPSPVFIMDVCENLGELSILEIGDFHSAGWYASDKNKIVSEVSNFSKSYFKARVS